MQYRASFLMLTAGQFLSNVLEFVGIWALFDRFGRLEGWGLAEVAVFYGVVNCAYALCDATSRGFDTFHLMVKTGDFDRLLLRPRSTVLQLAGQELTLRRAGRFAQGAIVLAWGLAAVGAPWTWPHAALLGLAVLAGASLFYGIILLQATLAFWTTESLEIMNTMSYGGVQTAQYPLSIYRDWFRRFFTFVVPLAAVSYYPTLALVGRTDPLGAPSWAGWVTPALGPAFCLLALRAWGWGVRHYRSTGS